MPYGKFMIVANIKGFHYLEGLCGGGVGRHTGLLKLGSVQSS